MCNCVSCEYTDSFSQKCFAEWPKGEPKGPRKAKAEYAAHVAFGKRSSDREFSDAELRFVPGFAPRYSWRKPSGAHLEIPTEPQRDTMEGWTTAAYIAEFDKINKLVVATQKDKGPIARANVRITPDCSPSPHFRRATRPRQHRRVYAMESKRTPRGMADKTKQALAEVASGTLTPYAAAKKHGIALSTIYRANARKKDENAKNSNRNETL